MHVEGRILFLNFAFIAELPKIQQLVLPFLIRCQYRKIVVSGLHILDHRGQTHSLLTYHLETLERDDPEVVHSEYSHKPITDGSEFGAEDVFFG